MVRLALFMNANTKNSQMKYCPCPKYDMIYRSDMYNLQVRKKHLKNEQELQFTFQNMLLLLHFSKYATTTTAKKYKMVRYDMNNFYTRLVQFKEQKKSPKCT